MPIPEYNEQAARQAVQYMRNLNDTTGGIYPPGKYGIPGEGCIATATSAYGPQSYATWNQDFYNNPQKYNFQEIPIDSLKAGDLFQEVNNDRIPFHTIMVDSVMPTGDLKFTYSPGKFHDLEDVENGRPNIRHLANYPIKDRETGKPLGKAYRFVGETPTEEDMKKIKEIKGYSDKQIKYYNLFNEKSRRLGTDKKTNREEAIKVREALEKNEYARPDWETEYYNLLNAYYEPSPSKAAAGLLVNQYKQGGKIPKFKELSNKDRYRIIRMGVQSGIHSVSDIEHIFDSGGHLFDGTSSLTQAVPKKLTDYDQDDWSALYEKQQAANNAKLAAAQAEWDKMHQEILNNPDAYDPVDIYKYIGKRPEVIQDINKNEQFENDAKVATKAGIAAIAAPYIAAYAPKILANPMVKPIAKSMMAGTSADAVSELATGKPIAEHTKNAAQYLTGLNPKNNVVSNFVFDTFGNPFYGFTGESAQMWSNAINKGTQIAKNSKEINKRLVETAMRTTSESNPLPTIAKNIKQMKSTKEGRDRLKTIGKYILLNERNGKKGYYNSFAESPRLSYDGFFHERTRPYDYGNDMIDAFLYSKEIDPKYGLNRVSVGNPKDFGPFEKKYIPENYADKLNDIQVYEVANSNNNDYNISFLDNNTVNKLNIQPQTNKDGSLKVKPVQMDTGADTIFFQEDPSTPAVNVGGFLYINGKDLKNLNYRQGWDIWKFNPKDYMSKWIDTSPSSKLSNKIKNNLKNALIKRGLTYVDKLGTPIVTKSKWAESPIKSIDEQKMERDLIMKDLIEMLSRIKIPDSEITSISESFKKH